MNKIILASKSGVRKKILDENGINCEVIPANVDEDAAKESLLNKKTSPEIISKNLAELKANKVSKIKLGEIVLGADSVIDLNGELISKPKSREEAINILKKLQLPLEIKRKKSNFVIKNNFNNDSIKKSVKNLLKQFN